jgi:uncharacterized membrane protein
VAPPSYRRASTIDPHRNLLFAPRRLGADENAWATLGRGCRLLRQKAQTLERMLAEGGIRVTTLAAPGRAGGSNSLRRFARIVGWCVMAALALLLGLYAARYLTLNPAVYLEFNRSVYIANAAGLTLHVGGALAALVIGPFQFLPQSITRRYLNLHRLLGRIYLLGVLVGGLGGLYMAVLAFGGFPAKLGFAILAGLWLLCGAIAYRRIRARQIQSHRQWMVRTYALTFAAVTLRLWLAVFQVAGLEFLDSYIAVAWLAWVPNLLVAEWIAHRLRTARLPTS